MGQALPKPAAVFRMQEATPILLPLAHAQANGSVIRATAIPTPPAQVIRMTAGVLPMLIRPEAIAIAVILPQALPPGSRF